MTLPPDLTVVLDETADLAIVTVTIFLLLRVLRGSRARLAVVGVAIIGIVDLLAIELGLTLTAWLFRGLFVASALVLLLGFQDDLKRFFERLAAWGLRLRRDAPAESAQETVIHAAFELAGARRGALIVVPGHEPLDRHLEGGVALDGLVTDPLLLSLFDPHSPGHDGAVVIEAGRVRRFGAHLPLSADAARLGGRGTRHAAALGLAERSDALVIVVSEERGRVSVARHGELRTLAAPDALRAEWAAFTTETRTVLPAPGGRPARRLLAAAGEWGIALALAGVLWTLVVLGSEPAETALRARVEVANLPGGYALRAVQPAEVTVTVSGVRRGLFLLKPGDVSVRVDALLAQLGRRTFELTPDMVRVPAGIAATSVEPGRVELDLQAPAANSTPPRPGGR